MHTRRAIGLATTMLSIALFATACASDTSPTITSRGITHSDFGVQNLEIAPLFSVETFDGGTFSLGDHLLNDGRPVFLNLWASWCFPCRTEMPAIEAASRDHTDIKFVGVAIQDPSIDDAKDFADEVGATYTMGFDTDKSVDRIYRPFGIPASYIISADGVILERIFREVTEEALAEKFEEHFG